MFKKLLVASAVLAASSTVAFAAAPYVGASMGIKDNTSSHANYRGFDTNLSLGYGGVVSQNFYLAAEAFVVPFDATITNNNGHGDSIRTSYGYGLSIIPGLMLTDHTMGYARVGAIGSRFTTPGQTAAGGQLGLGMQTSLTPCVDLRGEYVYTSYRSVSGIHSPKSDQFNLGLVYKFE